MRVTIAGSAGDVRAVVALAVGLRDAGHEAVVVESAEAVGIEAIAAAASGSDAVVGLSNAGPWAVSAAELVGAGGGDPRSARSHAADAGVRAGSGWGAASREVVPAGR